MPLISRLWSMGKTVAVPAVHPVRPNMAFYRFHPATRLVVNRFGIFEPAPDAGAGSRSGTSHGHPAYVHPISIDLILAPLVAFDAAGSRLGMGAGFYDRYLGALSDGLQPLLVGLAHDIQRVDQPLTVRTHDIPLDAVVTESGWQAFTSRAKV